MMENQNKKLQERAIIEVSDLRKKYGATAALDGLELKIPGGKLSVLIGPNGSGKTTLLKILSGLAYPDQGEVKILESTPANLNREKIAFQPEVDHLCSWMKLRDLIDLYSSQFTTFNMEKSLEITERMNLDPDTRVSDLSRGMRARFKLALSMAREVELYLLDEPLAGIDPQSRSHILETLNQEFAAGEKSVIMSTHEVMEAEKYFDYVVMLENGKIRLTGYADGLREEHGMSLQKLVREVFV